MAFGPLGGKTCEFLGHGDTKGNINVRHNSNGNVNVEPGDTQNIPVVNSGKPISGT